MALTSSTAPLQVRHSRRSDRIATAVFFLCAIVSILVVASIALVLISETFRFFQTVPIGKFLTGTEWAPQTGTYGVLPLVSGTLMIAVGSLAVGLPLGLGAAVFLSEYASQRVRRLLKPTLEILAGVPTVVVGFFALNYLTPKLLRPIFGADRVFVFNAAAGAIAVGLLLVPIIASISDDAMRAVPSSLREAAYGMGASKRVVTLRVVIPAAFSGIAASVVLAVSRAVGETLVVSIAAGNTPRLTANFFDSIQTLTAYIAQTVSGESAAGTLRNQSLFAVAALLFATTFVLNMTSVWLVRRFREVYE